MNSLLAFALALALSDFPLSSLATAEAELSEDITVAELRAHVYRLASPDFLGRRGAGAARTAQHLTAAFARLGLEPAFDGSYSQPIPWLVAHDGSLDHGFVGRNVGAVLPGSDPQW